MRSDLCGLIELSFRDLVPGEEFVEPPLRHLGDAGEHISEPSLRVDVVELGGADQRIHCCRVHAAAVGNEEQPCLLDPELCAELGI